MSKLFFLKTKDCLSPPHCEMGWTFCLMVMRLAVRMIFTIFATHLIAKCYCTRLKTNLLAPTSCEIRKRSDLSDGYPALGVAILFIPYPIAL